MGGMLGLAFMQLRGAWRRSLAAAATIFVTVCSFVVLTGTVTTQRLEVTRTVANNYRSTYDILVRPRGSAGELEKANGLVRPNFLSGGYGGITLDQVRQIADLPGIDVAAPVAVLGQSMRNVVMKVDVGGVLGSRQHAMVRFSLDGAARNNTAHTNTQNGYLYLTRAPLGTVDDASTGALASSPGQVEQRDGRRVWACLASDAGAPASSPSEAFQQQCWSSASQGRGAPPPRVEVLFSLPLTVQAIDPDAEARLTGLDGALVQGRGLNETDSYSTDTSGPAPIAAATAFMASALPLDFRATLEVDELSEATLEQVLATTSSATRERLVRDASPVRRVKTVTRDAARTYGSDIVPSVDPEQAPADQSLMVLSLIRPSDVTYVGGDPLRPAAVPIAPRAWRASPDSYLPAPSSVVDTGYRHIRTARPDPSTFVSFRIVGTYDPARLPRPSKLNEVPLETYRPSTLQGADARSRSVLGGRPMRSDLNPGGYLQSPPAILVPLKALPLFKKTFRTVHWNAPVSSVRVRVAGVDGLGPVGREKIRDVADRIRTQTGLAVDITIGASLQNRPVLLPATASGTPRLLLNERWTKKGVAIAVTQALDVKSLALFIIILTSGALTLALIASATLAARRQEFAILACVGWTSRRLSAMVATELLALGLGAGIMGALASAPIADLMQIDVAWWQVVLAVPLGALLAVLPGLAASVASGRTRPMTAFAPRASGDAASRLSLSGAGSLGLIMMGRRPGRAVLGVLAVALAVASSVLLGTIVGGFNGAVVGSFLGDAVALQVRGPDVVATVILGLLGATAVCTMLLVALVEDASAYATLQAVGWPEPVLMRAVVVQGAAIGLVGAVVGVVFAVGVDAWVIGHPTTAVVLAAAAGMAAATLLGAGAALLPALLLRRLPTAQILSGE